MILPASDPSSRILLVEGQNDRHVIGHLCMRHQSVPSFSILDKGGIEPLLDAIEAEITDVENRQAIGILVDANDDPAARWQAVAGRLAEEGIAVPRERNPAGTIIDTVDKPRVGIWLMPDNTSAGELEDFVAKMIPGEDPVWPLSQSYIAGIPQADRKFAAHKTLRAQIHAWLAAREDPRQMGLAIRTGDLDIDGLLCRKFVAWLTSLFG